MRNPKALLTLKHKAFLSLSIYAILVLHVYILFPDLSVFGQLFQALLRFLVLSTALASTYILIKAKSGDKLNILKWIIWLMIIPYPIYNIFQIRHIAEIFHLQAGEHFAPGFNVDFIWKCLPTLMYSFISGIMGFSCIYSIVKKYFCNIYKQLLFSILILSISSAASLFGLHSRLDTYHLFTHTFLVFKDSIEVFSQKMAIVNYLFCTGFFIFCFGIFYLFLQSFATKTQRNLLP